MIGRRGNIGRLPAIAFATVVLFLAGCTATQSGSGYQPVYDESVFRDRVVDRPLHWPGGFDVRFSADGQISGRFPNGPVVGIWQWRNQKFCRTIAVGGISRDPECLEIELSLDQVRFKRENGGYFLPYRIGHD